VALAAGGVVLARDQEPAHVVVTVPAHAPVREGQAQVHAVPVPRHVVVETDPRAGWKAVFAHDKRVTPDLNAVKARCGA